MGMGAIGSGLSGMQGFQRALDVSSNNVANTLSTNFRPAQASFSEASPAGSGVVVSARKSATDGTQLESDMVNQLVYKAGFQASAKIVKTADDLLGSLLDTKA
jgi:flagellar basal-body rod protein FlgC